MTKRRRILITGGSGLLALNWACAVRDDWDVVLAMHGHSVNLSRTRTLKLELDDPIKLGHRLDEIEPNLVVHTVGLTSVDGCEQDHDLARHVNATIAGNVAQAVASKDIPLIHISTDQLYSGDHSFYRESDPPSPINEYGRSKALAEKYVQDAHPDALLLRTNFFCWGHAKRQSFSDWLIYSLRAGKALNLFDDVYFTPILVDVLAQVAHELIDQGVSGIVNIVGDERISKYAFALKICEEFGLPTELIRRDQLTSAKLLARRPMDMSLDNSRIREVRGAGIGEVSDFLRILHEQEAAGRRVELYQSVY